MDRLGFISGLFANIKCWRLFIGIPRAEGFRYPIACIPALDPISGVETRIPTSGHISVPRPRIFGTCLGSGNEGLGAHKYYSFTSLQTISDQRCDTLTTESRSLCPTLPPSTLSVLPLPPYENGQIVTDPQLMPSLNSNESFYPPRLGPRREPYADTYKDVPILPLSPPTLLNMYAYPWILNTLLDPSPAWTLGLWAVNIRQKASICSLNHTFPRF